MPRIQISRDTLNRVKSFNSLGEQLLGEPMTVEECAESLIFMGMRSIVEGLWKPHDPNTLLLTLEKLAEAHPQQVYPFLAQVLKSGELIRQEREEPVMGFQPPPTSS